VVRLRHTVGSVRWRPFWMTLLRWLVLLTVIVFVLVTYLPRALPAVAVRPGCSLTVWGYRLGALVLRTITGRVEARERPALPLEVLHRFHIVIDAPARRLILYLDKQPVKTYVVAVGRPSKPTPIGYWHIKEKDIWGEGFGARWLGLDIPWGVYGIHGTNKPWSIGTRASAGCVRMHNRDVIELFDLVVVGTPVTIRGPAFYRYGETRRIIRPTHIGSDVLALQRRLQAMGLYPGPLDGKFGPLTEKGVREFQRREGLEVTGVVDPLTYERLGLVPLEEDPNLRPGGKP